MEADSIYISIGSVIAIIIFAISMTYKVSNIKSKHENKILEVKNMYEKGMAIVEIEVKDLQTQKKALWDKLNLHGNEVADLKTGQGIMLETLKNIQLTVEDIKKNINELRTVVRN